jgi:hypothetical protein
MLPRLIRLIITRIRDGDFDPYIEVLLSELHDRKRELRGVPGFSEEEEEELLDELLKKRRK